MRLLPMLISKKINKIIGGALEKFLKNLIFITDTNPFEEKINGF